MTVGEINSVIIVGIGGTLVSKIVWDWLQHRNGNSTPAKMDKLVESSIRNEQGMATAVAELREIRQALLQRAFCPYDEHSSREATKEKC